jgi:hypothetical protein
MGGGMSKNKGLAWTEPVVKDYGSLVDLTKANTDGAVTDAAFPAGTPKGDITFS